LIVVFAEEREPLVAQATFETVPACAVLETGYARVISSELVAGNRTNGTKEQVMAAQVVLMVSVCNSAIGERVRVTLETTNDPVGDIGSPKVVIMRKLGRLSTRSATGIEASNGRLLSVVSVAEMVASGNQALFDEL